MGINMNRIGDVLRDQGRSQIWLSEQLEKSYNMVNSYVKNRRQPSLDDLFRIAKILNVDVRILLFSNDEKDELETNRTVKIPILGTASCGQPILAVRDNEGEISISPNLLKIGENYFILRASGTSMNKSGINDGDLVLIREQSYAANGESVVALIDNEVTIKNFYHHRDMVILKPNSSDENHQAIILTENFKIQGVVERILNF